MKKKRYILPDEKSDAAFAAEPTPAYHGNVAVVLPENDVDECDDDIDWDRIPAGFYPANEEEAIARIAAIEAEYERTGIDYSAEEFENELKAKYPWLT